MSHAGQKPHQPNKLLVDKTLEETNKIQGHLTENLIWSMAHNDKVQEQTDNNTEQQSGGSPKTRRVQKRNQQQNINNIKEKRKQTAGNKTGGDEMTQKPS